MRNEHEKRSEHEIEDEPEASKHLSIKKNKKKNIKIIGVNEDTNPQYCR